MVGPDGVLGLADWAQATRWPARIAGSRWLGNRTWPGLAGGEWFEVRQSHVLLLFGLDR
jgi:hypothetical protein